MSIWSAAVEARAGRRRWARYALWIALPLLGLAFQIAAKQTAQGLDGMAFGPAWLARAAAEPWVWALVVFEIASFIAWMVVLAEMKLSAAFPLSAVGYVLVIAAGWTLYREPADLLQIAGGALILTGAWLISRSPPPTHAEDPPC